MWPICYEDINKLDISIGMGLLVAAFILFLSNSLSTIANVDSIIDKSREDYNFIKSMDDQSESQKEILLINYDELRKTQMEEIRKTKKLIANWSLWIFMLGLFFFLKGYTCFSLNYIKKQQKN